MSTRVNRIVDEIFREALALAREARASYVRGRCRGDPALELSVISLLEAAQAPDEVLNRYFDTAREELWRDVLDDEEKASEDLSGQRIDAWRLTKRLARGGLATVYLADRDDGAYEQTVAFKVLRRGLDTDDLIARFRAERQMLSTLDHPSIARLLDGGALRDGRPYLVLEYIDGVPITAWCANNRASLDERIRLLMDVLQALHHAHTHLIVHRDIKPSNILVSSNRQVSLLDFGIAKLLDPEAVPGASTMTRTGLSLLTPGYGSPEQLAGHAVTTASDIYQVGQVMYELLTGKRPFEGFSRPDGTDAVAPSRVLSSRGAPLADKVQGDLDAITAKAMHADPLHRYASAMDMRDDLQRYLEDRPIFARPDTFRYRLGKLARRRPWLLPTTVMAILASAIYVATLAVYTEQLQVEKRRAMAAQTFLVDILRSPDPFAPADPGRGQEITVLEALDIGMKRLQSEAYTDPVLRISLLNAIASVYASLDQHQPAVELREESLALERGLYGDRSEDVLASLAMLARQRRALGEYEQADAYYDEQLQLARQMYANDHPAVGAAEAAAAEIEDTLGNEAAALGLYQDGIRKMRAAPSQYAGPLINALVALANRQGRHQPAKAMATLAEAFELATDHFGVESLSSALVLSQIATIHSMENNYREAGVEFRKALAIYESRLGPEHGSTLSTLNNVGILYMRMGEDEEAEKVLRKVLDGYENKYGSSNVAVANTYQNLATSMTRQGRYDESVPLHRKAFDIYQAQPMDNNLVSAYPLLSIAYAELKSGRYREAETAARLAHEMLGRTAAGLYEVGVAKCLVGRALEGQQRTDEAERMLATAREVLSASPVSAVYREVCGLPAQST